ncbi:hypothetical protein GW17_00006711 [Ensete ventricosum]|nr:hypothetical protein GW17_00006711 [Ensete ventricosum]
MHLLDCDPSLIQPPLHPSRPSKVLNLLYTSVSYGRIHFMPKRKFQCSMALRLAKVKSMHRVDAFENSPGVCRKLVEGIGSLLRWRKGVRQKKTETRRKIIGEDRRTYCKIVEGCRSMREIRAVGSSFRRVNHPGGG